MIICLGPVCVPLHLLLPFLVALAHQRGYLLWFKREWVTFRWWGQQCNRLLGRKGDVPAAAAAAPTPQPPKCCEAERGDVGGDGADSAAGAAKRDDSAGAGAAAAGSGAGLRSRAGPRGSS